MNICNLVKNLFLRSFGDSEDSHGYDFTVPAGLDWIAVCECSNPCKLVLQNLDSANDLYITFNRADPQGGRLIHGDVLTLDDISGVLYAKSVVSTNAIPLNVNMIALRVNL
jgi:hypothetical protein